MRRILVTKAFSAYPEEQYEFLKMSEQKRFPIPVRRALRKLGEDVRDARRRRRIPTVLMSERAGISRATLAKIEKGDPAVSMGGYASVLFVLGMIHRLQDLADGAHDLTGRELADEALPERIRIPRNQQTLGHPDE